jgi:hypothetical protein
MTGIITDCFEIKGRGALEYGAAGVVVMFKADPAGAAPTIGDTVLVVRSDGWFYRGKAEDVRDARPKGEVGLFLRGLSRDDVPVGAEIKWGSEIAPIQTAVA